MVFWFYNTSQFHCIRLKSHNTFLLSLALEMSPSVKQFLQHLLGATPKVQELRRREMWSYSLKWFLREKHYQRNPEDIEPEEWNEYLESANLSLVWSEKTAKTLNLHWVLKVCFQVLIGIWKNANTPSVSSKTLILNTHDDDSPPLT